MPIMVERASNADRARYVLRTSPSVHGEDQTIKLKSLKKKKDQERRTRKPRGVGQI